MSRIEQKVEDARKSQEEGFLRHTRTTIQSSGINGARAINQIPPESIHWGGNGGVGSVIHGGPRKDGARLRGSVARPGGKRRGAAKGGGEWREGREEKGAQKQYRSQR